VVLLGQQYAGILSKALEAATSWAQGAIGSDRRVDGIGAIRRLPSRIEDAMDGYRVEETKEMTSIHYYGTNTMSCTLA